jgi:hypothetical protein
VSLKDNALPAKPGFVTALPIPSVQVIVFTHDVLSRLLLFRESEKFPDICYSMEGLGLRAAGAPCENQTTN